MIFLVLLTVWQITTPLYAPASGDPNFNIHSAFTMLTNTYGVPSTKIHRTAFYGRSQTEQLHYINQPIAARIMLRLL